MPKNCELCLMRIEMCEDCRAEIERAKWRRQHPEWICQCGRVKETSDAPCCAYCWEMGSGYGP